MRLASPAADMQTTAAQGHGGMPGRFEWQTRSSADHLPGAAPLGPCCPHQKHHEPQIIEVDLGRVQSESVTTAIQAPTSTPVPPPPLADLQLQGALE